MARDVHGENFAIAFQSRSNARFHGDACRRTRSALLSRIDLHRRPARAWTRIAAAVPRKTSREVVDTRKKRD